MERWHGLVVVALFRFASGTCGNWIVPETWHDSTTVKSAAYMLCPSSIRIAVVETGGVFTREIIWPENLRRTYEYGLIRIQERSTGARSDETHTWSYRSAYIGHVNQQACRTYRHPFSAINIPKNKLPPWLDNVGNFTNCYISGTIRASWLAPRVYGMEFDLNYGSVAGSKELLVSILGGIECAVPLGSINSTHVHHIVSNLAAPPCAYGPGSSLVAAGRVTASFRIKMPPTNAVLYEQAAIRPSCTYDTLQGAWHYHLGSPRNTVVPWVPAHSKCKTLEESFNVRSLPTCKDHIGIIGDSNTDCIMKDGLKHMCGLTHEDVCVSNAAYTYSRKTCRHDDEHCLIANILRVHDACLDNLSEKRKNMLFFNLGAHMPQFSPQQVVNNFLGPVVEKFRSLYTRNNGCLVISGVVDPQFEKIPDDFKLQWMWRNSWRTSMRNDATRDWVQSLNDSRIHYLDIFSPTLALHYDAHADAIHFSIAKAYEGIARFLYSAAVDLCGFPSSLGQEIDSKTLQPGARKRIIKTKTIVQRKFAA